MVRYRPRHVAVATMDLYSELWVGKVYDCVTGTVLFRTHLHSNQECAISHALGWIEQQLAKGVRRER